MTPRIFFDLDGTLIDARRRLYDLFQRLVPRSSLTIDEYWRLKRSKIDHRSILTKQFGYTEGDFAEFEKEWLALIETEEFLEKDTIFGGVLETLRSINGKYELLLVTSRQSILMAHWQLNRLGLFDFFDDVLVTEQKVSKADLIRRKYQVTFKDYMIGDTGYDVLTGKQLGMKTIAVTYGFLSKEVLRDYKPDFMVDVIADIAPYISDAER